MFPHRSQCVIEYLRASGGTSTIALWGRSMGAATALLHGERDPSIAAMVLDSAFSSLVTLSEEMVEMGRKQGLFAPGFIVRMALQFVRSSVQKTAGFDITKLTPIDSAEKCFIPALFIAAEDDNFVNKSHRYAFRRFASRPLRTHTILTYNFT
jgi:acetyl esterase/lipase